MLFKSASDFVYSFFSFIILFDNSHLTLLQLSHYHDVNETIEFHDKMIYLKSFWLFSIKELLVLHTTRLNVG